MQGIAQRNTFARQAEIRQHFNPGEGRPFAPRPDYYAGRDGQVYQYRQNGWSRSEAGGNWNRVAANPGLEMQRQARAFGGARAGEFRSYGGFSGMAGRPGGFGGMPRTSFGGFGGGRPGAFGGRGGGGFRR